MGGAYEHEADCAKVVPNKWQWEVGGAYKHRADGAELLAFVGHESGSIVVILRRVAQDRHADCFLLYRLELLFMSSIRVILL